MSNLVSVYTLPKLSSTEFRYDNHELNYFSRLEMLGASAYDLNGLDICYRRILADHAIGYADATYLSYKPQEGDWAIMFEDDNFERFWCHVPKDSAIIVDEYTGLVAGSGITLEAEKEAWPPIWDFVEL